MLPVNIECTRLARCRSIGARCVCVPRCVGSDARSSALLYTYRTRAVCVWLSARARETKSKTALALAPALRGSGAVCRQCIVHSFAESSVYRVQCAALSLSWFPEVYKALLVALRGPCLP